MIKPQKNILIEEISFLIKEISEENLIKIVAYLYSNNIILNTQKELIENERGKTAQCLMLLDILPKRGKKAFGVFIDALNEVGLKHAAEKLVERNEENDYEYPILINESRPIEIGGERDILLIPEGAENINSYEGFVVIDKGRNTNNESLSTLRNLFTRANYNIYTMSSLHPNSDEIVKIPILLLFCDIDEDYKDNIRVKFSNNLALIFTENDSLNVDGAYIFYGTSNQIIDKLIEFLSNQNNDFSIIKLINHMGISGTHNLSEIFKLKWHL